MKVYYRISDKSYIKSKLPGTNKELCLKNFLGNFSKANIIAVADNCSHETVKMVKDNLFASKKELNILETSLGNAGSFRYALLEACTLSDPEEIIYMVEDDYLHGCMSEGLICEGLERARYVTLYDHPDKYQSEYGFGEVSQVFKTQSTHWRHSISTTMTVAAKAKTFKEDMDIWLAGVERSHPNDHQIFSAINERRKNSLAVAIPGVAYHTDLTYFEVKGIKPEIPDWVTKYLAFKFTKDCGIEVWNDLPHHDDPLTRLVIMEVYKNLKKEKQ